MFRPTFLKDGFIFPKEQGLFPHSSGGQSSHITSSYSLSLLGLSQIELVMEVRGSGWLRDKNLSLLLHPMTPVCRHHRDRMLWPPNAPRQASLE